MQIDILGRGTFGSLYKGIRFLTILRSWNSLDGSRKALIPLRIVVFQTDLEFDGLDEVAAFFSRGTKEFLDRAPDT